MELSKDHWQKVDGLLDELLDVPEAKRLAHLNEKCPPDSTLHKDVLKLLKSCTTQDSTLDQKAFELLPTFFEQYVPNPQSHETNALKGVLIGPYTLDKEVGRGGMGVVYRAHRTQGDFKQTVAIKLLLNVTVAVAERFRKEQQALASLKHPNITHLYDGGLSESGHPFLVMEYIEGTSITDYCENKALTINERLALLNQVLDALAFSHKNLIVHRDIKPSNIMVTATGQVKLLDFSIAKLMDSSLNLEQTETQMGLFTPISSAPEQVLNQTITVATDIYQLGLLYFRLLSGHNPLPTTVKSLHELVQLVCHTEVGKPSQVVAKQTTQAVELVGITKITAKQLSGDLDAIIAKMLRKKPNERYASIEALKADIYAYEHFLPVDARKAVAGYEVRKYLRRNWRITAAVTTAIAVLFAYAISMNVQNTRVKNALATAQQEQQKAELEKKKAEQVAGFLTQTFEAADPNKGGLKGTTAADLLESARTKINEELKDTPEVQAELLNIIGVIYYRQRDFEQANELLTNLLENNEGIGSIDTALLAESQLRLAQQRMGLGKLKSTEELLRQSLLLQEQNGNTETSLYGETKTFLSIALFRQDKRDEAMKVIADTLAGLKALGGKGDRIRSYALHVLAMDQFVYGNLDRAVDSMREALIYKKKALGAGHSAVALTQLGLAQMLVAQEKFQEAEVMVGEAYDQTKSSLPEDHPQQLNVLYLLALITNRQQRYIDSDIYINKLLSSELDQSTNSNQIQIKTKLLKVENLIYSSKVDSAFELMKSLELENEIESINKMKMHMLNGWLSLLRGDLDKANLYIGKGLSSSNNQHFSVLAFKRDLAALLLFEGRYTESEKLLQEILETFSRRLPKGHSQIKIVCLLLQKSLSELGKKYKGEINSTCKFNAEVVDIQVPVHIRSFIN